MESEYDVRVEGFHKLESESCFVDIKSDEGRDDKETSDSNKLPLDLGTLVLTTAKGWWTL